MSSNSGPNDRFTKPSRGKGRGRGKKQGCDERSIAVDPQQQALDKDRVAASYQKPANEKQRKKVTDKTRKSRKPDQAIYVPKSRKPDQAIYMPRSQRNQEDKTSPISTDEVTEKAELVEGQVKWSQNDKAEPPPPKKKTVAMNDLQAMPAVEPEVEHEDVRHSDDYASKDHDICKPNVSEQTLHSVGVPEEHSESTQSNQPFPMEVEPQDVGSADPLESGEACSEDLTLSSNSTNIQNVAQNESLSPEIPSPCDHEVMRAVSGECLAADNDQTVSKESNDELKTEKELNANSQDQANDITMTSSEDIINGHKCAAEVENVSKVVDENLESFQEQVDLVEDHSAINVETPQVAEENNEKHVLEKDALSEPHQKNETIEERVELVKEATIPDAEISMDSCAGEDNAATAPASGGLESDDGDDWDAMFDDSGDALANDAMDEISEAICNVKVSVKKTKQDYYNYTAKDNFDYGKFSHVIEIFDFPSEFKTADLIQSFSGYRIKGFDIQWVDDRHALGIFSSPSTAQDALSIQNPMLRTRSLNQATRESKLKARNFVDCLQPSKPRPETSASAARRLVSGALGMKSKESKEQKAAEIKKLRDAKEKKKTDKRLTEDVWEGNTWSL